jgi:hypothetical protein
LRFKLVSEDIPGDLFASDPFRQIARLRYLNSGSHSSQPSFA